MRVVRRISGHDVIFTICVFVCMCVCVFLHMHTYAPCVICVNYISAACMYDFVHTYTQTDRHVCSHILAFAGAAQDTTKR